MEIKYIIGKNILGKIENIYKNNLNTKIEKIKALNRAFGKR